MPEMRRICPDIPLLLVGLKKDLRDYAVFADSCLPESNGHKMAKKLKLLDYMECSSWKNENVEQVFVKIATAAAKKKNTKRVDVSELDI